MTWGAAMLWSATASSFGQLLLARVGLGAVTAAAGPIVASLVGDWFPAAERGRIYGYILTGELLGAGAGFAITGDIAALSWRAAFIILAAARLRARLADLPAARAGPRRPGRARGRAGRPAATPARPASATPPPGARPAAAGAGDGHRARS